jgi:predicted CXXCH cytochrome family protein
MAIGIVSAPSLGQQRVVETVHNLSTSGPGAVRAVSESQVCIFCHAPHNTQGVRPLWNRDLPVASYTIYRSSTLDALPGQPTGSSKLCLSCHDGTIALGSVLSRSDRIRMTGGDFIPAGLTNLGTDLSDDHPISFTYTPGLAASDRQLVSPTALPPEVKLDAASELQCTSCHDPHHNLYGDFLVLRPEFGELCAACHNFSGWRTSSHRTSTAAVTATAGSQGMGAAAQGLAVLPQGDWPFATVAENACRSCHRPHTAGGRHRLLIFEDDEENCLRCHNGQIARTNLVAEIDKPSTHDPRRFAGRHDPMETSPGKQAHVECADCHNPHTVTAPVASAGYIPIGPTLSNVRGVTIGGAPIESAAYEFEVCFRCHGDGAVEIPRRILRQAASANLRLKFDPANPSFHPVFISSPSSDTPSLVPDLAHGSLIRCTDCHNNDDGRRSGGAGPDGPHGSRYDFLLERNYTTADDNVESEYEYALCYKCHQRSVILSDVSFPPHRLHIVEQRTPCSVCHDPHGISVTQGLASDHTGLINFDTTVVRPEPSTRRLEFKDLGRFAGSCTLICHGALHIDEAYGQ